MDAATAALVGVGVVAGGMVSAATEWITNQLQRTTARQALGVPRFNGHVC
jgi:hypothetical protein